jgi:MFS family permease
MALFICAFLFAATGVGVALAESLTVFIAFRIAGGIAVGAAAMVVPMYIAETVPASFRGKMVALYQLAVVLEILLAYLANYSLSDIGEDSWRWMFASHAIPAILFFFTLFLMPEMPRWLIGKNYRAKAYDVLSRTEVRPTPVLSLPVLQIVWATKRKERQKIYFCPLQQGAHQGNLNCQPYLRLEVLKIKTNL